MDINDCTFKNLNEVTKDNDLKIIIVEVPIGNIPSDEVDNYLQRIIDILREHKNLEEYKLIAVPYRNKKEKIEFKKIITTNLEEYGFVKKDMENK